MAARSALDAWEPSSVYMVEVTGGSRWPADALHHYRDDPLCQAIASSIAAGRMPPPIIVVATPGLCRLPPHLDPPHNLVVLEGHLRLTAMLLARPHLPPEVPALLGTSPTMNR